MDNFYEQLISEGKNFIYQILKVFNYGFIVAAILSIIIFQPILSAFFFILAICCFFLKKNALIEYEYSFTNGEIDIDKIIEMKKRKNMVSFETKDIEILARENSDDLKSINRTEKTINCALRSSENIYKAVVNTNKGRVTLILAPDEKFINLCRRYNPRVVKI